MKNINIKGNTSDEILEKCKTELLIYFAEKNKLKIKPYFFKNYEKHI